MAHYGDVVWAWEEALNKWWPSAIIDPQNMTQHKRIKVFESCLSKTGYSLVKRKDIYIVWNYGINQYDGLVDKHLRQFQAGADVEARLQPMAKKTMITIEPQRAHMRHWFLVGKEKQISNACFL